jgi:hypothetical protein
MEPGLKTERTDPQKAPARSWMENWRTIAPILEKLRLDSIRRADTAAAIEAFHLAYQSARLRCPSRRSSGLVEQQRWFKRGHR